MNIDQKLEMFASDWLLSIDYVFSLIPALICVTLLPSESCISQKSRFTPIFLCSYHAA